MTHIYINVLLVMLMHFYRKLHKFKHVRRTKKFLQNDINFLILQKLYIIVIFFLNHHYLKFIRS